MAQSEFFLCLHFLLHLDICLESYRHALFLQQYCSFVSQAQDADHLKKISILTGNLTYIACPAPET